MTTHPYDLFDKFAPYLTTLSAQGPLSVSDLLVPELQLERVGNVEIYFAPFDYVNKAAKVILVGITPGFTQMEISCRYAGYHLRQGETLADVSEQVKYQASFAGTMRQNLVSMLDGIGLPTALGITSSNMLFGNQRHLLHATSAIRYPTFLHKRPFHSRGIGLAGAGG